MSDAPERILVEDERDEGGDVYVTDVEKLPRIALEIGSQYIRADIAEKRIEELEAEVDMWKNRAIHQNEVGAKLEDEIKQLKILLGKQGRIIDELTH